MFEMLLKQALGGVDMEQVKGQFQQFAQMFVEMQRTTQENNALLRSILARLDSHAVATSAPSQDATQQAQGATLLPERTFANDHDHDDHGRPHG